MDVAAKPKEGKKKKFDEWEVKNAVDTLKRAEEIKADPALMKAVSKQLRVEKKQIKSIADIVDYKNEKYGPKGRSED